MEALINNGNLNFPKKNNQKINMEKISIKKIFKDGHLDSFKFIEKDILLGDFNILNYTKASLYNRKIEFVEYIIENYLNESEINELMYFCVDHCDLQHSIKIFKKYKKIMKYGTSEYVMNFFLNKKIYNVFDPIISEEISKYNGLKNSIFEDNITTFLYYFNFVPDYRCKINVYFTIIYYGSIQILNFLLNNGNINKDIVTGYFKKYKNEKPLICKKNCKSLINFLIKNDLLSHKRLYNIIKILNDQKNLYKIDDKYFAKLFELNKINLIEKYIKKNYVKLQFLNKNGYFKKYKINSIVINNFLYSNSKHEKKTDYLYMITILFSIILIIIAIFIRFNLKKFFL